MSGSNPSPFSLRSVLLLGVVGFAAFIALLYFIGAGDTGGDDNNGGAHAASKGLNGYAGFARLLEEEGYDVTLSRSPSGLDTYDLLVLTPPMYADAEEIGEILEKRRDIGPTLVILPKWRVADFSGRIREAIEGEVKDGWVRLLTASQPEWTNSLPEPFAFGIGEEELEENESLAWNGMDLRGNLSERSVNFAKDHDLHEELVSNDTGHVLAHLVLGEENSDYYNDAAWTVFVTEPDLVNNYGMAEQARAELALELVRYLHYEDEYGITFDLTLNGLGAAQNLLTLAFRPPFLAATLSLLVALLIVGWRAFRRFGPPVAEAPATAFGKSRLIANGAGLVLRARRLGLLTAPYASLCARRIARRLGLSRAEPEAIDEALARALPDEEPFTQRAAALRHARRPNEILAAAGRLHELERKLTR